MTTGIWMMNKSNVTPCAVHAVLGTDLGRRKAETCWQRQSTAAAAANGADSRKIYLIKKICFVSFQFAFYSNAPWCC